MAKCYLCPRKCGVERDKGEVGYCGQGSVMRIARAALHEWEEPPISGRNGSGAIFFCGCSLRCIYCQNRDISRGGTAGREVAVEELADIMLTLQAQGAHNINLVTPTHFSSSVARALRLVKPELKIPVIYNCGGYESIDTLEALRGLIDIFMPDFKYFSPEMSLAYSGAADYCTVASTAIGHMYEITGDVTFDNDGMMTGGVLVRHLVLPGGRNDSMRVLDTLASVIPGSVSGIRLSLMSQYTPDFAYDCKYRNLHRRVTTFEYESVLRYAQNLGFEGFCQNKSAASAVYTPDFSVGDK